MRKRLLIEKYGPSCDDSAPESQIFRQSMVNMKLSIDDGFPSQIPGYASLFIGSAGCIYHEDRLRHHKITHIVCLTSKVKSYLFSDINYCRIPIDDDNCQDLRNVWNICFQFIDSAALNNGRILVHCYKGQSRSTAILCGYMITRHGLSLETALQLIRSVRPIAQPNENFMNQLQELSKSLKK